MEQSIGPSHMPLFPKVQFKNTDIKWHIIFWLVLHILHFINFHFTSNSLGSGRSALITTVLTLSSTIIFCYVHTYWVLPRTLGTTQNDISRPFFLHYLPLALFLIFGGAYLFELLEKLLPIPQTQPLTSVESGMLRNILKINIIRLPSDTLGSLDIYDKASDKLNETVTNILQSRTPKLIHNWVRNLPESAFNIYLFMGFIYLRKFYNLNEASEREQQNLELENKNLESEKKALEARNSILQMEKNVNFYRNQRLIWQITPHFLFNSLNNILHKMLRHPESAPDALVELSDTMRYVVYECDKEKVLLSKEIEFIKKYTIVSLYGLRKDTYRLEFNIHNYPPDIEIAPLILITFVENAIKHGIQMTEENKYMKVTLKFEDGILYFKVKNSQSTEQAVIAESQSNGIGIANTQQRLKIAYPNRHELILDSKDKEFKAELRIKLLYNETSLSKT